MSDPEGFFLQFCLRLGNRIVYTECRGEVQPLLLASQSRKGWGGIRRDGEGMGGEGREEKGWEKREGNGRGGEGRGMCP